MDSQQRRLLPIWRINALKCRGSLCRRTPLVPVIDMDSGDYADVSRLARHVQMGGIEKQECGLYRDRHKPNTKRGGDR
jgi:hypothetical protein